MRDLDRVRDKIEIRLEPRQVVLLGILTTAFSGGLFAAGYVVGTRFSSPSREVPDLAAIDAASRASRAEPRAAGTPVALGDVEFLFPSVLDAAGRGQRSAAPAPAASPPSAAPAPPPSVAAVPVRLPALAVEAPASEAAPPRVEIKSLPEPVAAAAPESVAAAPAEPAKAATPDEVEKAPPPPPDEVEKASAAAAREEDAPAPTLAAEPAASPRAEPPKPSAPQYTLQVKAVQDKAEADAFMAELRKVGFEPQMILADLPGKGRWYRIRVGRFADMDVAREFQRKYKLKSGQPDAGFVTDL